VCHSWLQHNPLNLREGQVSVGRARGERVVQNAAVAGAFGYSFQLALNPKSRANVRFTHINHLINLGRIPAKGIALYT